MPSPYDIHVLIPDERGGLTLASVGDLYDWFDAEEELIGVISNAGIDYITDFVPEKFLKIHEMNVTGDAAAYWGM